MTCYRGLKLSTKLPSKTNLITQILDFEQFFFVFLTPEKPIHPRGGAPDPPDCRTITLESILGITHARPISRAV